MSCQYCEEKPHTIVLEMAEKTVIFSESRGCDIYGLGTMANPYRTFDRALRRLRLLTKIECTGVGGRVSRTTQCA